MVDDSQNGGRRPVPDPTALTDAAIAKLKDQLEQHISDKFDSSGERIKALDRVVTERFEHVERQRVEQKQDTKAAVDAALAAAKEAVKEQTTASEKSIDKSESATSRLLEQQSATVKQQNEAISDKIDDLKHRMTNIESIKAGAAESRTGLYATAGAVGALVVGLVALIGLLLTGPA